jgi:hypothetical protein
MKKLIPFLVLLAGVSGALAQVVDFNNNRTFTTATNESRLVYGPGGTVPLVGTNFAAQLFYGADAASLQAVTTAPSRFRVPTTGSPGTWAGGNRTLTGFTAGQTVTLLVRAWDINAGATYDAARAAGGLVGESTPFTYQIPAAGSPPTAFYIENLRAFSLVPEPSVIGLGVIGLGALCMLRRRKA